MQRFGLRVRQARLRAKLSQRQLADATKAHHNSISDLERGKNLPTLAFACRLAKALNVNLLWLAGESQHIEPGVHMTGTELVNYRAYQALSPEEKQQLIDFMTDYHRARKATVGV
jgi:transcriptional regulator with XRE-family HTH domain